VKSGKYGDRRSVPFLFQLGYHQFMPRTARIIVPGLPHHVTARGNRREPIFFRDGDQDTYRGVLAEHLRQEAVEVWAYCFMPNHVHLILCPSTEDGLGRALGGAHRRWSHWINARAGWRGHLFDGRYASVVMDDAHLMAAVRYVSLNPVRARLASRAQDWPWSSVGAHLRGRDDGLVRVGPVLDRVNDFSELIETDPDDRGFASIRAAETTGRPLGTADFVTGLERRLGRRIARQKPGRKPSVQPEAQLGLI
jgi:putative transposase